MSLRPAIGGVIRDAGRHVSSWMRRQLADDHERRAMAWNASGFIETSGIDYDLNQASVVLDVGDHEAQRASDLYGRYCRRIEIFEPVDELADNIERRLARNPNVRIHHLWLAFHNCLPAARVRMESLRGRRTKTHEVTCREEFIWVNWRLRAGR
jgi:hypothetical protein